MAGARALALGQQVDLEIALLRQLAQVVMAHQPVEVERRGGAGIKLDRGQLGQVLQPGGGRGQIALGIFERRTLRQVDHDLQFRLVVERQQFHRHVLGDEQDADANGCEGDRQQEKRCPASAGQQRTRHLEIKPAQRADLVMQVQPALAPRQPAAPDAAEQPRRDDDRDEKREQHRDRGVRRDRAHIGPHQPADEHHRQQRDDDRQGRDDRRVADLGDRVDGGRDRVRSAAHVPVPDDVFDDDDRVVDQDADRKDQREQADPVDRVAHQPGGE